MKADKQIKAEYYDRFYRDKESKRFYDSALWRKAKAMKLARDPLCETCAQSGRVVVADVVHHIFPVKKDNKKKLEMSFLVSLCYACHNAIETELERGQR